MKVLTLRGWPRSDIPVRVLPVGPITVVVDTLSASDIAEIKNAAHGQMWRSNMSDLRQVGIGILSTVLHRLLSERIREIEVQPDGSANVLTRSDRVRLKGSPLSQYSMFARCFTVQKGINGWHVVRVGLDQLKQNDG